MVGHGSEAVLRILRGAISRDAWTDAGRQTGDALGESSPPLWSAPLSVRVAEVAAEFDRDGLVGLSRVSGPWAAAFRVGGGHRSRSTRPVGEEIIVARDPTGIMPLYWARLADGGVAVSDHLPTLALEPGVDRTIDPERVALRYSGGGTNAGWLGMSITDYRHIHAVPFGHAIAVAPDGTVRQVKFWDPAVAEGPDESMSAGAAAEMLRAAIDRAVARCVSAALQDGGDPPPRLGAEWSAQSPVALLTQQHLAASGLSLTCLLGADSSSETGREFAGVPCAALAPDPHMHRWTSALDYHRFPSRSRDAHVAQVVQARRFGLTDIVCGGGPTMMPIGSYEVVASLLARGHWRRARAVALRASPAGSDRMVRFAARRVLRDVVPEPVVGALRPARNLALELRTRGWPGDAVATASASLVPGASPAKSPLATSLGREQSRRHAAARSARASAVSGWMSGAAHRSLEGQWAYLAYFGIRVHQPLLDVELVEACLRIPDSVWAHLDVPGWPYWAAVEPWLGVESARRRSVSQAVAAELPPLVSAAARARRADSSGAEVLRTWRENDPAIAAIIAPRPISTGATQDPCDWGI